MYLVEVDLESEQVEIERAQNEIEDLTAARARCQVHRLCDLLATSSVTDCPVKMRFAISVPTWLANRVTSKVPLTVSVVQ